MANNIYSKYINQEYINKNPENIEEVINFNDLVNDIEKQIDNKDNEEVSTMFNKANELMQVMPKIGLHLLAGQIDKDEIAIYFEEGSEYSELFNKISLKDSNDLDEYIRNEENTEEDKELINVMITNKLIDFIQDKIQDKYLEV